MQPRTVFLLRSECPNWIGLHASLSSSPGIAVMGDTHIVEEARNAVPSLRPDVLITAIDVEGASAIPLLAELRATDLSVTS
jgi:DNA-binding NarL/FixJ family response regulator